MYMLKKCSLYLLMFLLLSSIYHDITSGSLPNVNTNPDHGETMQIHQEKVLVKRKFQAGETVLSIIEKINQDKLHELDMTKIINDFKQLNPDVDPFNLQPNESYYFLVY